MNSVSSTSLLEVTARPKLFHKITTSGSLRGCASKASISLLLVLMPCLCAEAQTPSSYVPSVVVSSVSRVPTTVLPRPTGTQTNVVQPVSVSLDACENIYVFDSAGNSGSNGQFGNGDLLTEIPAGGGTANVIENVGEYPPQKFVGQDPTSSNVIVGAGYTGHVNEIPLTGCVPKSSQIKSVGGQGPGPLFYYYNAASAVGDFQGNTYISTQGTCCVTGIYYLIKSIGGGESTILLANQPSEMVDLAVDKQMNVYFVAAGAVYELPYTGSGSTGYAATPVLFGSFRNPVGLSFDSAGNLYVADSGAYSIYEVPNEGTRFGSFLNVTDQFVVSSEVLPSASPAVSARGDVYFIDQNRQYVSDLSLGNANFGLVPLGTTVTRTINFQFNALGTPAMIELPSGVFASASASASLGTTNCVAGTSYSPSGVPNCQVTIAFTPTSVGRQTSSVILADAKGNPLATAYLEGVGQGPLITVDPGTFALVGSGLKAPAGIAVDHAGNTFIADAVKNVITEIPAKGGVEVNLAVATASPNVPISGALGVAVDGAGNLYVADTGNNRVIEVRLVDGAYASTAAVVVASGLSSPAGVFVSDNGDLYVADTGDNAIVFYPNNGGSFGPPHELGTSLNAPLAVTQDTAGNLYIADSGNNRIVEVPIGAAQQTVYANILNPSGLATDSSNALFAVDQGNLRVLRIPSVGGLLNTDAVAEVSLGVANPYGIALDAAANLYVTDRKDAAAYTFARSQVALSFGDLAVGTSSGPLPLTVESAGNLPIELNTPYFLESGNVVDFAMTSPTGACADGAILAAGMSCDLVTSFTPSTKGARSAAITVSGIALALPLSTPPIPITPKVTAAGLLTLSGFGASREATTTKLVLNTTIPGLPFAGEALSLVATITRAGTAAPTGNVSFVVDGIQTGLIPSSAGSATLALNSGLTAGAHSIYAVYKGDSANNGSESVPLAITIAPSATPCATTINYPGGFASSELTLNGGATITGNALQLTDGKSSEARSAFYPTAVPVGNFVTDFTFQLLNAQADGFAFVVQTNSPSALGSGGGGLGYGGIPNSAALKFDLFSNYGEGQSSTGFFVNGAYPGIPSTDLLSKGIDLHSGHVFAVHIVYDGSLVYATISDTLTKASANVVDRIPAISASEHAFLGFTGGSGRLSATQNILSWSYSSRVGCPLP